MSTSKITAVQCDALSYSGTTWLNLTLGAHDHALTIGPTYRVWDLKDDNFVGACLIHGKDCEFWTGFNSYWDREENFLVALGAYSGRTHFLFDNPSPEFVNDVLEDKRVNVRRLRYVRDGRAITASYARKFPDKKFYDTLLPEDWFYHSFMAIPAPSEAPNTKFVYYEKCAQDITQFTQEIGHFVGLDFTAGGHRFWEADHHITTGNAGPINMVRLHQGLKMPNFESKDVYEAQYRKLSENPDDTFFDERWRSQLTREDLFHFDLVLGEQNAKLGYERDTFTDEEVCEFWERYGYEAHMGERKPLPSEAMQRGQVLYNAAASRKPAAPIAALQAQTEPEAVDLTEAKPASVAPQPDLPPVVLPPYPDNTMTLQFRSNFPEVVMPDNTATTTYFDTVDAARMAEKAPYKITAGPHKLPYINTVVNNNMFVAYGPTYAAKTSAYIAMDPIVRYRDLLETLKQNPKIVFKTYQDGLATPPKDDEIVCLIRHDVDGDINAAIDMARIEQTLDIPSSYYLLHTAPYYMLPDGEGGFHRNHVSLDKYLALQNLGHEVAIHTDALTLYQQQNIRGTDALVEELDWLRRNGLNITGTLAHNSFGQYGSNNYSVFKGRPLNLHGKGGPVAVEHNGNYSPLRELDEVELGLHYEGNDVFWQPNTPVQYYCLMNQSLWFKQSDLYNRLAKPPARPKSISEWMDHDTVLEETKTMAGGQYLVLVVHPLHYGLRAGNETPFESCARVLGKKPFETLMSTTDDNAKPSAITKIVKSNDNGGEDVHVFAGLTGKRPETLTLSCLNETGTADRPLLQLAEGKIRILYAGGDNLANLSVPVDSKLPQLTARLLRVAVKSKFTINASAIAAKDLTADRLKDTLDGLPPEQFPQILMLGLSARHATETDGLIAYANSLAGKALTVFGYIEQDDTALAHDGDSGALGDQEALADQLRALCDFQVFNPYTILAAYGGATQLYWQSTPHWTYHSHYKAAKMIVDGLTEFVKVLAEPQA